MIIYLTLRSDSGDFKLYANYDDEKKQYYMPSIELCGEIYSDSACYIWGTFLSDLYSFVEDKAMILKRDFPTINKQQAKDIIELLERGKQLGWDRL